MGFLVKFEKYEILEKIQFAVSHIPLFLIKNKREKRKFGMLSIEFHYFNKKYEK